MCLSQKPPDPPKTDPAMMTYETETNGVTDKVYSRKDNTQPSTPTQPRTASSSSGLNAPSSRNSGRDSHEQRM